MLSIKARIMDIYIPQDEGKQLIIEMVDVCFIYVLIKKRSRSSLLSQSGLWHLISEYIQCILPSGLLKLYARTPQVPRSSIFTHTYTYLHTHIKIPTHTHIPTHTQTYTHCHTYRGTCYCVDQFFIIQHQCLFKHWMDYYFIAINAISKVNYFSEQYVSMKYSEKYSCQEPTHTHNDWILLKMMHWI